MNKAQHTMFSSNGESPPKQFKLKVLVYCAPTETLSPLKYQHQLFAHVFCYNKLTDVNITLSTSPPWLISEPKIKSKNFFFFFFFLPFIFFSFLVHLINSQEKLIHLLPNSNFSFSLFFLSFFPFLLSTMTNQIFFYSVHLPPWSPNMSLPQEIK